jgi:HPt (histidine-containing phosphotransfer) domain-containing protein
MSVDKKSESTDAINLSLIKVRYKASYFMFESIVKMFPAEASRLLAGIDEGLVSSDWPLVLSAAHELRGVAGLISAESLHALIIQLEEAVLEKRASDISNLLGTVKDEVSRCLDYIPVALAELGTE